MDPIESIRFRWLLSILRSRSERHLPFKGTGDDIQLGPKRKDSVVKAADYCAKAFEMNKRAARPRAERHAGARARATRSHYPGSSADDPG